jgi:acetyl-CoA C-acetyltransferase
MSVLSRIYILGGAQTDFARKWSREGHDLFDLFSETLHTGLEKTKIDAHEIDTCHVGNFAGELLCGQGHLGGFFAQAHPHLRGKPASRHEAACASGSMAILAATAELEAGRYDLACVLGVEMMRNQSGRDVAHHLGAAAWVNHEGIETPWVWPYVFSKVMDEYQERYGLDEHDLALIAQQNFTNAQSNPYAQTRDWTLNDHHFVRHDEFNPRIEGNLRKYDCSQITDGGAVLFLATPQRAKAYAKKQGIAFETLPYIQGWGHRTTSLKYEDKYQETCPEGYLFPQVRACFKDAYRRAGIEGPNELDGLETHDCFSITQYMAIEHCGLTQPGQGWEAIRQGWTLKDGRFAVNPSGGLMGLGHPVGATGVRMVLDAAHQVTGQAGETQVPQANKWCTYNVGGSTTTSAVFIVGNEP